MSSEPRSAHGGAPDGPHRADPLFAPFRAGISWAGPLDPTRGANDMTPQADPTIRPFRVSVPEEDLRELKRRITTAIWSEKETVADDSQGPQLETIRELARYWASEYDWRRIESRINSYPHFLTEID